MDIEIPILNCPADRTYVLIKKMLLSGQLPQGRRLSYAKLSRQINISVTPVREAVNRLASEGLIDLIPNVGAVVKKIERQGIIELYEIRCLMEGYAAAQCAKHISRSDMQKLQAFISEQRQLIISLRHSDSKVLSQADNKRFLALDVAFHQGIVKGALNKRLAKMISEMRFFAVCSQLLMKAEPTFSHLVSVYRFHLRILKALERGNEEAARYETARHIRTGLDKQLAVLADNTLAAPSDHYDSMIWDVPFIM